MSSNKNRFSALYEDDEEYEDEDKDIITPQDNSDVLSDQSGEYQDDSDSDKTKDVTTNLNKEPMSHFYRYSGRSSQNFKKNLNDNRNIKKVLCQNMITTGICSYGNKCDFAHRLEEQNIDDNRKDAYGILFCNSDLSNINLHQEYSLYKSLLGLTKLCEKYKCTGGYNCKWGVCEKKYQICIKDLNYGNCIGKCEFVHLTKRGLVPFYYIPPQKQQVQTQEQSVNMLGTLLSSIYFKQTDDSDDSDSISIASSSDSFKSSKSKGDDRFGSIFNVLEDE